MLDIQPTDLMAADLMARHVKPIEPGGAPLLFKLTDDENRQFSLSEDHISGGYLVVVLVPDLLDEKVRGEIEAFEKHAAAYEAANANIVVVTAQTSNRVNRKAKRELNFSFPVFADPTGYVFAAYGLHKIGPAVKHSQMRSVVITPYRQIRCYWDIEMTTDHAAKAAALITQALSPEEAAWTAPHAPVLVVPKVFSKQECVQLIGEFEKNDALQIATPPPAAQPADFKIPVYEYNRQDRVDHVIGDPKLLAFLDQRLQERVLSMVKKVFAFTVTRRENLTIARYAGPRSGVEIGHRDNVETATHRRFALSLSLNDNYEGGALVFREYGNRGYRLPRGSAIVFSSSLLHEVEEITKGVRYNILSHFFNDASAAEAGQR